MNSDIVEILTTQGKNTVKAIQDLKQQAKKLNKERSDLYEKFCANEHSFRVYTYMDQNIRESNEVQAFLQKVEELNENFVGVNTELETTVDEKKVAVSYKKVVEAYNDMVKSLGFAEEVIL
ncbi:hypothetical protein [Oceanobacillus sp. Castelsardo]|uniref:hypothetical protein n=1 Tax=Oceanobacillus sp. Castelsardo TaxID=1851204 RepID=UPI0009EEC019|nr:hypothetical protein [Oceanobacillus sp. Castelsardo]